MPTVTFVEANGTEHVVEAETDLSLMQIAVNNTIPGILADCGGSCTCATCHVYVDPRWAGRLPPGSEDEALMLEGVVDPKPTSRLCCQLRMRPEWDGLVLSVPERQA